MKYQIHPDLDKVLDKLSKRDKKQFQSLFKKMEEIINSDNPDHYKNLRKPLQKHKSVHVCSSFVLLFSVTKDAITFRYYDHHDKVYNTHLE